MGSRCSSNSFDLINNDIHNTIKEAQVDVLPQDSASQAEEQKFEEDYYMGANKYNKANLGQPAKTPAAKEDHIDNSFCG